MIFRNRSPKGVFGQNISDLPNGPLTGASRSYQSAILNIPCIIVYEMYRLPNILLTLMLINLRMRFEQIAFVLKRIVPLG